MKISAILNCFKRPETLEIQIEAIEKQSIKPHEILIWVNASEQYRTFNKNIFNKYKTAISNYNYGVWSRFAHALNTTGDYVCIFDDDTIPGRRWFENCANEMQKEEALYGTRGIKFSNYDYFTGSDVGWHSPNQHTTPVDIVGHSWFFPRRFLGAFWQEAIIPNSTLHGEDIHLSYSIQKYLNARTLVPPHPQDNQEMWGSMPDYGWVFGGNTNAISWQPDHRQRFADALFTYQKKGFKLLRQL